MNVRDYDYIVEIAAQGSISRTAYRLSITPGTLSHKRPVPVFTCVGLHIWECRKAD